MLFARQQTRRAGDAEDVLQEALVKLAKKVESGEFVGGQGAWMPFLYTQIRRESIDLGRRNDRRKKREDAVVGDELIGETGIIGFAIFVYLIGLCVRDLLVCRRLTRNSEGTFLWCLVQALTLIMPLYFLGAATLEAASKPTFWIIVAMPIIIRRLVDKGYGDPVKSVPAPPATTPSPAPALD